MDTSISLLKSYPNLENSPLIENNKYCIDNLFPFQQNVEYTFQNRLKELEYYLDQTLDEQEFTYKPGTEEEETLSMTKAKAKEYFKNHISETIRRIKKTFEDNQFHHIMPQSYIVEILNALKESIDINLHRLTEQIKESISKNDPTKLSKNSFQIKKKTNRKGKTKIPKKALTILRNWLTEHFQDPYPSHAEKMRLSQETGISLKQVQNWFTNARGRVWRKTCNQKKFLAQVEDKLAEKKEKENHVLPSATYVVEQVPVYTINPPPTGYFISTQFLPK